MEIKKRNSIAVLSVVLGFSIAFILDIKYKGLVYRTFTPKKVQS